jgi:hypothetical protein
MKNYTVKYIHGQFIDVATDKRIIPQQGAQFGIQSDDNAFLEVDEKMVLQPHMDSEQKKYWAVTEFGEKNCKLFMVAGTRLYFRVGNSKKVDGDEDRQYIFECILLEDLYLFKLKKRSGNDSEDWRLANCQCKLERCLLGGLALTEQIPTTSLNSLFCYTVMFYFSMQRSGSCNVFNTFFLFKPDEVPNFHSATWGQHKSNSLTSLRKKTVLAK